MDDGKLKMRQLMEYMIEQNATDLHITANEHPYLRVNGSVVRSELPVVTAEECEKLFFSLLTEEEDKILKEEKTVDLAYGEDELGRVRINLYMQRGALAAAVRKLARTIPSFEELGLPVDPIKILCARTKGLILVTGPVGMGKSTTLASMVDYINQTRKTHIISIEDPVEYVHKNIRSLIHQREVGRDTPNFKDALKYILREDPDVVLIGEMRDLETISSAVTIAETGHLVLATLHTMDASESIRRIVDVFPAEQQQQILTQLSCTLSGVINQLLLPDKNGKGRVLAVEVMLTNSAIQNLIRENKVEHIYSHIQMGTKQGMLTMNQSLSELSAHGRLDPDVAMAVSTRQKELARLLGRGGA